MSVKKVVIASVSLGLLAVAAAFVMGIVGIWTGDDRWGYTAMLTFLVGFLTTFAAATYPGVDW